MQRDRLQDFSGQGTKVSPVFTDTEMARRQDAVRGAMVAAGIDAALFTSYHNVCWLSGFLYCQFGRRYGLVVTSQEATVISAGIDGGQPWRRSTGSAVTYTDWQKDNYFHAVAQLTDGVTRLGIEFDHITLDTKTHLERHFPHVEFVDISVPIMRLRMVKSPEEIALITAMAEVADIGGAAVVEATAPGVGEHEVALHSTETMVREIARRWPEAELMDSWTWFQSGINTDGAHNPVTSRKVQGGDILSLNCFPMVAGYYVALERTLFMGAPTAKALHYWQVNCEVHDLGKSLIRPGVTCAEIAHALNAYYSERDLLQYRSFGYGHSFGVLCHYYGREAGLELREDCHTVLEPGMVVSMEPMLTIPQGEPGSGGYREHDILVVTENGCTNITHFPYGPDHLILES